MKKLKKITKILFTLTCILLTIILPIDGNAYTISHRNGYYPLNAYVRGSAYFSYETERALHNSCLAWNNACDSGDLVYRDTNVTYVSEHPKSDGVNSVTKQTWGDYEDIAQTYYTSKNSTTIYEADIALNVSHPYGTAQTSYDTQTVLTHEIGHLLGLGDSYTQSECMYHLIYKGEKKGIGSGDKTAINIIY